MKRIFEVKSDLHLRTREELAQRFIIEEKNLTNGKVSDERVANMEYWLTRMNENDGAFGKLFELYTHTDNSRKKTVGGVGKCDGYITIDNKRVSVEIKHGGGRIDNVIKHKYVVYMYCYHKKIRGKDLGYFIVEPKVIPSSLFIEKLQEFNAIKEVKHGGVVDGHAIQSSNKKLYEWLLDYPIPYLRSGSYNTDDFEELD